MENCTAVGCYLAKQGGLVSFWLVTLAGLADGINPCAIGMIVTLLGYLIVFSNEKKKAGELMLKLGLIYIATVFLTYLTVGLAFYQFVVVLQHSIWADMVSWVIGGGLLIAGLIQVKDFFWPESPIHLRIPGVSKKRLNGLVEKGSIPAVIVLGVLVTVLETPCSLPLYVGTATLLAGSGLPMIGVAGYFLYYNLLFVLPLIVVLVVMYKGREVVAMREWEHKMEKWMKLSLGVLLLGMAGWLLLR